MPTATLRKRRATNGSRSKTARPNQRRSYRIDCHKVREAKRVLHARSAVETIEIALETIILRYAFLRDYNPLRGIVVNRPD
jgi:hypothetical protein